ncbi:MAG: methanogen output domain 1-containing protein [Rubrimonas sp.]|uniref:methanogen output domain 1-containing protein n=1 Tax=Rubrimonas sp. TaxID=2036015 RepID=UPI002FDD0953
MERSVARAPDDREHFLQEVVGALAETIEQVVGLDQAQGFIAVVGDKIGRAIDAEYRGRAGGGEMRLDQVAEALVDFKRRIDGGFSIAAIDAQGVVLVNTRCPYGREVLGRESLCMMTSTVFGRMAAENLGFAHVRIDEAIARGDRRCVVSIRFDEDAPGRSIGGRSYFRTG